MALVDPGPLTVSQPLEHIRHRSLLGSLWDNPSGRVGCMLAGIVVLAAICGALGITPYAPQFQNPDASLKAPSLAHPIGTDQFGRDLLSLVLQGLYISLKSPASPSPLPVASGPWEVSWPVTSARGPRC